MEQGGDKALPGTMGQHGGAGLPCREGRLKGDRANQDLLRVHRAGGKQWRCPRATLLCPASSGHRDWEPLREQLEEDAEKGQGTLGITAHLELFGDF